jgi:PDZ domain-containing protein
LADPAQVWEKGCGPGRDALAALAGPVSQILLAGLAYAVWNLQLNAYANLVSLFLVFFNVAVAAIDLYPAFPLDGGRLVRSIIWFVFKQPSPGTRLEKWFGFCLIVFLFTWGVILALGHARLVWEAAAIAFIQAALILISFLLGGPVQEPEPALHVDVKGKPVLRIAMASMLMLPMLIITAGLLPLNYGLRAPGTTAPVESMIRLPPGYGYASKGSLILTSVIPQAPILFAEWVYAHLDKSVQLVPEEEIVPTGETVHSQAEEGLQALVSSETIAIVEGLRLAGYQITVKNDGVVVASILADSPAFSVLKTGDIIVQLNGQAVTSTGDLRNLLLGQTQGARVTLGIERGGRSFTVTVTTLPPAAPGGPVRIGIGIEDHVTGFVFPFPVEITPEKIIGGPSAGLMFTLAVYDLLTPTDLTRGWVVAGTGTIDLNGNVGPIGGIQQKVVAAERAGAKYFLAPAENYQDALKAAKNIKVIRVTNAKEAIAFLDGLSPRA